MNNNIYKLLVLAVLFLLFSTTGLLIKDISGTYILKGKEECYILAATSQEMILYDDGTVENKYFGEGAVYTVERTGFFEKQIRITFNRESESIMLPIERTIFGTIKINACLEGSAYYVLDKGVPPQKPSD